MNSAELTQASRRLAYLLRHSTQYIDAHGWAQVSDILRDLGKRWPSMTQADLEEIVRTDSKGRYALDGEHRRIRANQGHSVPVDVGLEEQKPPAVLYHGTATRFLDAILEKGLLPMSRLYCHLSTDIPTAQVVGARHGKPVVLQVDAAAMVRDGHTFYCSENGVWLTADVPPIYLTVIE